MVGFNPTCLSLLEGIIRLYSLFHLSLVLQRDLRFIKVLDMLSIAELTFGHVLELLFQAFVAVHLFCFDLQLDLPMQFRLKLGYIKSPYVIQVLALSLHSSLLLRLCGALVHQEAVLTNLRHADWLVLLPDSHQNIVFLLLHLRLPFFRFFLHAIVKSFVHWLENDLAVRRLHTGRFRPAATAKLLEEPFVFLLLDTLC